MLSFSGLHIISIIIIFAGLHIIIFDEIDAICKARGSSGGESSGVNDTVVNQLLSKIDGVDQLNNILVIGMTNRWEHGNNGKTRNTRLRHTNDVFERDDKISEQQGKDKTT